MFGTLVNLEAAPPLKHTPHEMTAQLLNFLICCCCCQLLLLNNNQLPALPSDLGDCSQLQMIFAGGCVCLYASCVIDQLGSNKIEEISGTLSSLPSLHTLHMGASAPGPAAVSTTGCRS